MSELLTNLTKDDKMLMLAYDQGMEHGPDEFDDRNFDPKYILQIAREGKYTCVAMQYGIASKFWKDEFEDIPLVVKLNGKTRLGKEILSLANASVSDALNLGASAVGYTIYLGSPHEAQMIQEFSQIRDMAHAKDIPAFAWMYPFITPPSSNDDELEAEIVAYAARVGAELGADVIKIKYPRQADKLPWIIQNAVGTKVIMSGGDRTTDEAFLDKAQKFMAAGGDGIAVGRNAWQHPQPLEISAKLHKLVWPNN